MTTRKTINRLILTASFATIIAVTGAYAQEQAAPQWAPPPAEVQVVPIGAAPAAAPAPAAVAPAPAAPVVEPAPVAAAAPQPVVEPAAAPAPAAAPVPVEKKPTPVFGKKKPASKPTPVVDAPTPLPVREMTARTTSSSKAMSLSDAVAVGVATNPEYGVVANNRRATDEELRQARALYRPSIDMRADTGYEHSDDASTRARGDDENMWRFEAGVTLTQMLFDGWETKYENERQEARVLSASRRVGEVAELTGLDIVEAFLDVMRQREQLKIARENVAEHISLLDQIQDSASAGRTTDADVEQAKARLASARAVEASVREALRQAESSYNREVGDPPQDLMMPQVPADKLNADVDREVKVALHQSPTIAIFEADMDVAKAEREGTKSTFYPQLDLQLNARQGNDINGVDGRDRSAHALVVMNWNLYRGGGDTARVREHINREAQTKEARVEAARQVESDVRQTWARMVSAGERARQFAAQADANVEVVKSYKDQFDLNRRTLLDVLDAQNELFVSRSNMINAEFLEMFAVYRLLALKGELLPTLGVDYPRESDPAKM